MLQKKKPKIKRKKTLKHNKKSKIKYEVGGAVVYSYQKYEKLIDKYNIETHKLPIDRKGIYDRHHKDFWDGKPRRSPLDKEAQIAFFIR